MKSKTLGDLERGTRIAVNTTSFARLILAEGEAYANMVHGLNVSGGGYTYDVDSSVVVEIPAKGFWGIIAFDYDEKADPNFDLTATQVHSSFRG